MIKEKIYETEFKRYISNYDLNDKNISLKINHMYRVQEIAAQIAYRLNLPKEDVELSEFLGLYHDIGRFEQLTRFNTYNDDKSFDHGDYGAEILEKDGFIKRILPGYDDETYELLIYAVKCHNKFKLNRDEKFGNHYLCKIIRDADKLDILRAMSDDETSDLFFDFSKEQDRVLSEEIKIAFYNSQTIPKDIVKTRFDNLVLTLAFVFDINYSVSKDYLLHLGNIDRFINAFTEAKGIKSTPLANELFLMREHLKNYLRQN